MATVFPCLGSAPIPSFAASDHRKSSSQRRISATAAASSSSWWTPIFGWSSDPDYINTSSAKNNGDKVGEGSGSTEPETARSRSRFSPGCFTEEKAKQLRLKMAETAAFHDIMYHSAIASRLASDVSGR